MFADLHIHTHYSDGLDGPATVVEKALAQKLAAIAITDHDSVSGIAEAIAAASSSENLQIIPGIELSTTNKGKDVHILGYFIDYNSPYLIERLKELRKAKTARNQLIIDKLNQLGIEITIDEVNAKAISSDTRVGRPHIAQVLSEKGVVKSIGEAFSKYLSTGGLAYVKTESVSPEQGVDIVKNAGGAAVVAHPGIYKDDLLLQRLIDYGLDGIEVYHPDHNPQTTSTLKNLARKNSLIITAGSDYHGFRDNVPFHAGIGSYTVPSSHVEQLQLIANKRKRDL